MPDVLDAHVVAHLRRFAWLSGLAAILLGSSVLMGWLIGSPALETVLPGFAAMSPATASGFVLAGLSLSARRLNRQTAARATALLLLAAVAVILAGYLTLGRDVVDPAIEHGLNLARGRPPGLMAPATACGFWLLGAALLALERTDRIGGWILTGCSATGLLISTLALLCYAYDVEGLYAVAFYRTTALHTAAGLFGLFLACLVSEPERGWAAIVASGLPSGSMTRTQLLLATLLPSLTGLVVLRGIRAGSIAPGLGMATLVASTMVPLILRILHDSRMLDNVDMQRRAAVEAQRQLNERLEERVRDRTASLALSEARLRTYFDNAPEGLMLVRTTAEGGFVLDEANPALHTMYARQGRSLVGLTPQLWFDAPIAAEVMAHLQTCLRSGRVHRYTARRVVGQVPKLFDVLLAPVTAAPEMSGRLIVGSVRDVTDAELREEQLRQSQKMEAVGQLTGGLAHDFNNLLTGISGNLELFARRIAQNQLGGLDRYIGAAQDASKRAAALTHRLLAFSRQQTLDPRPTGINRLIAGMEELIRRTMGPAVAIEVAGATGLWPALVDANQLENVLLNLCLNARDAMPDGGRLRIETANEQLDQAAARERELAPGHYVALHVRDDGTGMTPEVIARVFEPFFTTKPLGQGTGLGLSMIYGFARQSGGQVRIRSARKQGTTMSLYLPRYGDREDAMPRGELADAASIRASETPRAEEGETVLVVDDEPTVRVLVAEVLEALGYTAIEAADGAAGLRVLNSGTRLDLLVTDVGLPGGINGRQVADAGRAMRPDLKVLFITGYAENAVVGNGDLEPGMQVLTKPFAMESLVSRVRNLIAES